MRTKFWGCSEIAKTWKVHFDKFFYFAFVSTIVTPTCQICCFQQIILESQWQSFIFDKILQNEISPLPPLVEILWNIPFAEGTSQEHEISSIPCDQELLYKLFSLHCCLYSGRRTISWKKILPSCSKPYGKQMNRDSKLKIESIK